MKNIEALRDQLGSDLAYLQKSVDLLKYSLDKANIVGLKQEYSIDELDTFEVLTSRYARTADILTQKVLKNLFITMQEDAKTFIDRCNLAEKLEMIDDAKTLYQIRKLRNDIAHEYCITEISELFSDVLRYTETLIKIVSQVKLYIKKHQLL